MSRQTRELRREGDPFTEREKQEVLELRNAGWGVYEAESFIFDKREREATAQAERK